MNTLRLEIINLHAPYKVLQDPERHNNFYFVSDSGARFDIDFTVNESIIPSGAYEFGITIWQIQATASRLFAIDYLCVGSISMNVAIFSLSGQQRGKWMV